MDEPNVTSGTQEFKIPNLNSLPRAKVKTKDSDSEQQNFEEQGELRVITSTTGTTAATSVSNDNEDVQKRENCGNGLGSIGSAISIQTSQLAKYASMISQLNYKEPKGSAPFDPRYSLEILRNGSIIETIDFKTDKSFYIVGRLPTCDISGEHPTISRIHAVLQFVGLNNTSKECERKGLYIYDLNSTHGTFLNKNQLIPTRYYRLHVGHVVKFGNSSRLYVVVGPEDDVEEESEKTVTELLNDRNEKELDRKRKRDMVGHGGDRESDDEEYGASWGMAEDAVEENSLAINPFAIDIESSELSLDNPKRTLHSWFEREGHDLVYDVSEKSSGHFICTINLPLDNAGGTPVIAEVDGKGKKKEIMAQCALKACQILDKYGVLRKSNQESFRRKSKTWEEKDYYSSDEDTFLDRTGSVEKKRNLRMKQVGKLEEKVETYESLAEQYTNLSTQLEELEEKLEKAQKRNAVNSKLDEMDDPLDEFMQDLKSGVTDISNMKSKIKDLVEEKNRLVKLINLTKPASVTFPTNTVASDKLSATMKGSDGKKMAKILFGPRKGFPSARAKCMTIPKPVTVTVTPKPTSLQEDTDVIQIDEDSTDETTEMRHFSCSTSPTPVLSTRLADQSELDVVPKTEDLAEEKIRPIADPAPQHSPTSDPEEEISSSSPSKPKRKRQRHQPKKPVLYEYDSMNPNYSVWIPPTDQSGDGKTKLNEKLGY